MCCVRKQNKIGMYNIIRKKSLYIAFKKKNFNDSNDINAISNMFFETLNKNENIYQELVILNTRTKPNKTICNIYI